MVYTKNVADFVYANHDELCHLATTIFRQSPAFCSVDDVVQELYIKFLTEKTLGKFDPCRNTKVSTYLYRVLRNLVNRIYNSNEGIIHSHQFDMEFTDVLHHNEFTSSNRSEDLPSMNVEYEGIVLRNQMSDEIDGLNFDLDFFDTYLERIPRIMKRKKKGMNTSHLLVKVFRLMREGMTNKDIALKYNVSNMFITNLKSEIKGHMKRFGIRCGMPNLKKIRRNNAYCYS